MNQQRITWAEYRTQFSPTLQEQDHLLSRAGLPPFEKRNRKDIAKAERILARVACDRANRACNA